MSTNSRHKTKPAPIAVGGGRRRSVGGGGSSWSTASRSYHENASLSDHGYSASGSPTTTLATTPTLPQHNGGGARAAGYGGRGYAASFETTTSIDDELARERSLPTLSSSTTSPIEIGYGEGEGGVEDDTDAKNESSGADVSGDGNSAAYVWPRVPSDDSEEEGLAADGQPVAPNKQSANFFRQFAKRFGRTFHIKYFLPSDQRESDRIDLQHQISLLTHDDRLYHAPLRNPKAALDIGTGTGTWAIAFAERFPECDVTGTDLVPIKPRGPQRANCHFQRHDAVADDWNFHIYGGGMGFDYVHARSLGFLIDYRRLFRPMYENLVPGGWAEFQEWILHCQSADHSLEGTAIEKWNLLLRRAFHKIGKSLSHIKNYARLLEDAGFERVTVRKYSVPLNGWPPGKRSKRLGGLAQTNIQESIHFVSMAVFPKALGWSAEETEKLVSAVLRDLEDTRIHGFMTLMTVYARKPRDGSSSTTSLLTTSTRSEPLSSAKASMR